MFQENLVKLIALLAALNQLAQTTEARNFAASQPNEQNNDDYQGLAEGQYQLAGQQVPLAAHLQQVAPGGAAPANLDSDDDDDDDDRVELQPARLPGQLNQANSAPYPNEQPMLLANANNDQIYQQPATGADLKPAASKHYGHHGHGAKGWLDMGAWTGKKGAFGWYDKHPVGGKGK